MSEVTKASPSGPQWTTPWLAEWLKNLVAYCQMMGEPLPRSFRAGFKLVPPPKDIDHV